MTEAQVSTGPARTGATIISVDHVSKNFTTPDGAPLRVLDDIDFELREGEIVALLGKSGSGKSTLLRCIAGLIAPTAGDVRYRGAILNGANPGVAMVFQSFALLPWLTVRANVEMGLEARGVPPAERRDRAERVIDLIGLDGFESAYPKELSGGMRQRVGFARALVVEPDALLMDEPFSALDVLTAENLRTELLSLWGRTDFPTKAMLIVTHNIEEAVQLADRIFVMTSNPGRLQAAIIDELPRPRNRRSPVFEALVDDLYGIMTGATAPPDQPVVVDAGLASPTEQPLPHARVGGLAGLLEIVSNRGGRDDLPELAKLLTFTVDDLLPLVDAAVMLDFAEAVDADLQLNDAGRVWVTADILTSKDLFGTAAYHRAPLVRAVTRALAATKDKTLNERFFLDLLEHGFNEVDANAQMDTAIDWGRYGELFDFDSNSGELRLDQRAEELTAALGRAKPSGLAIDLRRELVDDTAQLPGQHRIVAGPQDPGHIRVVTTLRVDVGVEPTPHRRADLPQVAEDRPGVVQLVGRGDPQHPGREVGSLQVLEVRLLAVPPVALVPGATHVVRAGHDDLGHRGTESGPDLRLGDMAVLDGVMQDAGDGLLLGPAVLQDQRRHRQQMRHVRDPSPLAGLIGVEVRRPSHRLGEPAGQDRRRQLLPLSHPRLLSEHPLHQHDVEPLAELAAHLAFGPGVLEPAPGVQPDRRLVEADDAADHGMKPVVRPPPDQLLEQQPAVPPAPVLVMHIHRIFDRRRVRRAGPVGRQRPEPDDRRVLGHRHQRRMGTAVLGDPVSLLLERPRDHVERDRRLQHLSVVDHPQRVRVALLDESNRDSHGSGTYLLAILCASPP